MSIQNREGAMNRLKKDWADIAARSHVSEVGLDVDRAKLLDRYRNEEGLTLKQIEESGIGLKLRHISQLLQYGRYVASCATSATRITESRFRAYWKQIADPQQTKGRREIDPAYEASCFAEIRALVEAGKPPIKPKRAEKPATAEDIRDIKDVRREAGKVYARLKPTLKKLKGLLGCDRSTFAPGIIAGHAQVIEREIKELFRLLTGAAVSADE